MQNYNRKKKLIFYDQLHYFSYTIYIKASIAMHNKKNV